MAMGRLDDVAPLSSRIVIKTDKTDSRTRLAATQADSISSHDLDATFCSGLIVDGIDELNLARHGVWTAESLEDLVCSDGGQTCWEVMEGAETLKVELRSRDVSLEHNQVFCRSICPSIYRMTVGRFLGPPTGCCGWLLYLVSDVTKHSD